MSQSDYFRTAVLRSKGNVIFILDYKELNDLSIFNTYMGALGQNHRQMVIGVRNSSTNYFNAFEQKIFHIFKTDDNFLISRLVTKEAAYKIFANSHIDDEFFTVEANRLGKLEHCKIHQVFIQNITQPEPPKFIWYTKLIHLLQIGFFYKINIWTYKRMYSAFQTKFEPEEL